MKEGSDQLATLLFQISSPAHIPWGDQRWQEVLHGYDVWVHIDADNPLIERACQSMTKHAELSSNLAALSLHVTRMLRDLVHDIRTLQSEAGRKSNGTSQNEEALVADFSKRISSVAKARATAGSLNLLRLLCHPVIVEASKEPDTSVNTLKEVFTYHTRGDLAADQPAGLPLMHSLLDLIAVLGTKTGTSTPSSSTESTFDILRTPEIYDAAIFAFQLFFVLCGTQLYQPFYSSFESISPCHFFVDELFRKSNNDNDTNIEDESHNSQFWSSNKSVGSSSTYSVGNGSHRSNRRNRHRHKRNQLVRPKIWTPKAILETCLGWQLERPQAPDRSISQYYYILAQAAVDAKGGEKPGQDGLYENHMIVQATAPNDDTLSENGTIGNEIGDNDIKRGSGNSATQATKKNFIVDTTKGILTLSGSIIFLPFRLLNLMYGVLTTKNKNGSHELSRAMTMKKLTNPQYSRTRDILWLSDSLLADLGCSAMLFLASNNRNEEKGNIFRMELKHLTDNRWDHGIGTSNLPDLPNFGSQGEGSSSMINDQGQTQPLSIDHQQRIIPFAPSPGNGDAHLMVNYESLFVSFGRTLHNELGALLLYTIIQSSPSFAEWLGVRSDMDSIVMPLLRTLYFAFRSNTFMAKDYGTKKGLRTKGKYGSTVSDIRDCPFRSESQLYVIIILLLLFSQDSSFGRDVFRRVMVVNVPWYKERTLKGINLGSVIILTLLRSLIFNLNRLNDVFLLNNCLAVLENLSPSVTGLHEYASMRLVSVTVLLMKKHAKLVLKEKKDAANQDEQQMPDEDDQSNPMDMYSEATRTLLGIIKHGLSAKNIEGNAHLIYALVYHQVDFLKLCKTKYSIPKKNGGTSVKKLYSSKQIARITSIIAKTSELIQEESARSAPRVLRVIEREMSNLKGVIVAVDQEIANKRKKHNSHLPDGNVQNGMIGKDDDGAARNGSLSSAPTEEEFTFLYEEEADPEVFFVPYLWDLIVCVVTAGSMEWKKDDIKAFALLDEVDEKDLATDSILVEPDIPTTGNFSQNVDEMV